MLPIVEDDHPTLNGRDVDPLTGLANRTMFVSRVDRLIACCGSAGGPSFAVLVLDVDRFTAVNHDLGRPAGDALLAGIARRLEQSLRPTDAVARAIGSGPCPGAHTLARLGGDEFTVLLRGVRTAAEATSVARRLMAAVATATRVGTADVVLSCSVGLVMNARHHACADDMIREAEAAMDAARHRGGARLVASDAAPDAVSSR
jgi:GGDEF domain-containing protein